MTRIDNSRSRKVSARRVKVAVSARKTPTQERSRATVEALLDATARVLVREGYEHTSTNRVAQEAGVSIGSLYQYFPSKEALVAALVDRHRESVLALLRERFARLAETPPAEAIPQVVRAMLELHRLEPKLHRVLSEQVPRVGKLRARTEDIEVHAAKMVRAYLDQHRASLRVENLDLAVFIVAHAVESVTHAALQERPTELDYDALQRELSACVARYLLR